MAQKPWLRPCFALVLLLVALTAAACASGEPATPRPRLQTGIALFSTSFAQNERMPIRYTCDSVDYSPPLSWDNVPEGTATFVLVTEDLDASRGTWTHWVLYNIPGRTRLLPEGIAKREQVQGTGAQGLTDFNRVGYWGPCPPRDGKVHHYEFTLYALDDELQLEPDVSKRKLLQAASSHTLAQGTLVGTYSRDAR